ncbi:MAG: hypothetical protein AAF636_18945 [Pseudomonadota bacterium]
MTFFEAAAGVFAANIFLGRAEFVAFRPTRRIVTQRHKVRGEGDHSFGAGGGDSGGD